MSLNELASKYIGSSEQVLAHIEIVETPISLRSSSVKKVVEFARAYFEDASYYRKRKKFKVSLSCIAYCEGLLDALKLLGAVKFDWPRVEERRKRSGK